MFFNKINPRKYKRNSNNDVIKIIIIKKITYQLALHILKDNFDFCLEFIQSGSLFHLFGWVGLWSISNCFNISWEKFERIKSIIVVNFSFRDVFYNIWG